MRVGYSYASTKTELFFTNSVGLGEYPSIDKGSIGRLAAIDDTFGSAPSLD
jgi:hypothetical protein